MGFLLTEVLIDFFYFLSQYSGLFLILWDDSFSIFGKFFDEVINLYLIISQIFLIGSVFSGDLSLIFSGEIEFSFLKLILQVIIFLCRCSDMDIHFL